MGGKDRKRSATLQLASKAEWDGRMMRAVKRDRNRL
jgi:hypothetical protein